jgi:predicted AlkP superfamily phosphohydrolase/phosphomutase
VLIDSEPSPQSALAEEYRIYARETDTREATITENEALIESRVTAAEALADRHDWSFMMVQFQRTDAIFHTMGHDTEAVRRVYRAVDQAIGRLLALVDDDTTVIIVSDHGIHEYERKFRCNTWLRDKGWLQSSAESERRSWGATTKPTADKSNESTSISQQFLTTALTSLRRIGVTPQRAERALSIVGLAEPVRQMFPDKMIIEAADHVDWTDSKAYYRSVSSLGIRCNVRGRDPDGVIAPEDFDSVRETLVDALERVTAPDGKVVFEDVYDRHNRHGSDVANESSAPDIVVRPNRMVWKITDVIREPIFETTDEFNHTYQGLFIAAGPSLNSSADNSMEATAISPLILELFGYHPAPVMDGEVPTELLESNRNALVSPPEPENRTYLIEEKMSSSETVTKRLEQLGYLE